MGFGYALLKGRGGAAGYIRESGGGRDVSARSLRPGTAYALYTIRDGETLLHGIQTADSGGNARWTAPREGGLFIAEGSKVALWEGGDDAFLRASAWLNGQRQKKPEPEPADHPEAKPEAGERQPSPQIENSPPPEPIQTRAKESPPERAYTLRPAGSGEPVDALPERQRR